MELVQVEPKNEARQNNPVFVVLLPQEAKPNAMTPEPRHVSHEPPHIAIRRGKIKVVDRQNAVDGDVQAQHPSQRGCHHAGEPPSLS